jgi:hypothetical protein
VKISQPNRIQNSSDVKIKSTGRNYQLSGRFLSIIAIIATAIGGLLALSDIPGYLKANYVLLSHPEAFKSLLTTNDFEDIQLDIKFKHFQKIEQKRQEALERDLLISSDDDFVPGTISNTAQSFDCKLRLKGDLSDHWESEKSSFRVRLKDNATIYGMSSFSLQRPVTRGNTSQFLFLESLRREGLIAVRYRFVNFTMNGKDMGVYAMEEHFSKELVESQKRRDGVIVSFAEHRFWKSIPPSQTNFHIAAVYQATDIQVRNDKRTRKSPLLSKQKVTALNLLRSLQEKKLQGDEVFSPEKLGRFLAICRLWNAEHGFVFTNINFYYDPITSRLEPIGFDGMPGSSATTPYCYFSGGDRFFFSGRSIPDNWVNQALRSPEIAKSYIKHLDLVTRQTYIEKLKENLGPQELSVRRILFKNLFWENSAEIWKSHGSLLEYNPWNNLAERVKGIRKELEEDAPAMTYARPSKDDFSDIEIVVRNALTQPVEIIGFESSNGNWNAKEILSQPTVAKLDPTGANILMPLQKFGETTFKGDHVFLIPDYFEKNSTQVEKGSVPTLHLITRILGMDDRIIRLPIPIDPSRFKPEQLPFIKHSGKTISQHSFLYENGDTIYVESGEHEVTEDLIIPPHRLLKIPSGTTLRFHDEAMFVCESPVLALGSEEAPITLTAIGPKWPGVLIANAKGRSKFEHVRISKTTGVGHDANPHGIDRGGWTLTGGVTFYHSPVNISHCQIYDAFSEDALNIIASDFTMNDSIISDVSSDAIDGDFVEGSIINCTFERVGGDAIDLSGSNVTIKHARVFETVDKALSAGEGSRVTLSDCKFEDIGYGIASKDLSEVRVYNLHIVKARVAALAAYQKKSLFGPSQISVQGLEVTQTPKHYLIQKGSSATINGENVEGIEFDVNSLYQEKTSQR